MLVTKGGVSAADKSFKPYRVYDSTYLWKPEGTVNATKTTDFYLNFRKFTDFNRTDNTSNNGYNDIAVIRLAEMYMIAAEAELQLNNKAGCR